jgi:hypothetical protein
VRKGKQTEPLPADGHSGSEGVDGAHPQGTEGSDSLFATFHILAIATITEPNITNNFRHFPSPQEQLPSGVLVIVYLYLFGQACQHVQTRVLAHA